MHFSGSYIAKFLHPYSHPHLARNPVHLQRRFALLTCKFVRTQKPVSTCVNTGLTCMLCGNRNPVRSRLARARTRARCVQCDRARTCAYAKRSTPSLETRAKNNGSNSGAFSPKTRASRKMRSPSSRRLSSPVRSVAMTSPFST